MSEIINDYKGILNVSEEDHPLLAAIKQRLATHYFFFEDQGFRKEKIPPYILEASYNENFSYLIAASQTETLVDVMTLLNAIFTHPNWSNHRNDFLKKN